MKKMMDESCARRRERARPADGRGQRGGTHGVHEEPVLVDGVGVEEELGALERLREEVARAVGLLDTNVRAQSFSEDQLRETVDNVVDMLVSSVSGFCA